MSFWYLYFTNLINKLFDIMPKYIFPHCNNRDNLFCLPKANIKLSSNKGKKHKFQEEVVVIERKLVENPLLM